MSHALYSEDGYVGDVATNMGLAQMAAFIVQQLGYPVLKQFMHEGMTEEPAAAVQELEHLLETKKPSESVKETLQELLTNLRKVQEIAIISQ